MVDVAVGGSRIDIRFDNYCTEEAALKAKLKRKDLPPAKRVRLEKRRHDLTERLIPRLVQQAS